MLDAISPLFGGAMTGAGGVPQGKKPYGGAQAARATAAPDEAKAANVAAVERIKEIGFAKWAEEERARKLEEMRAEILAAMGLSEADLAGMDSTSRGSIEQMIQKEIQERLAASSLSGEGKQAGAVTGPFQLPNAAQTATSQSPSAEGFAIGGAPGTGVSMGPASMAVLISAQEGQTQEIQARERQFRSAAQDIDPARDDARSKGLPRDPDRDRGSALFA